jgi:hypothetical protein
LVVHPSGLILINPEEEELNPPAGVAFLGCGIILTKINIKTKILFNLRKQKFQIAEIV